MLPTLFLYISIILASITETSIIAYDLAINITHAKRIEWSKHKDDDGNIKFNITFYKIPSKYELGFEKTFINKHNNCKSIIYQDNK